MSWVKRVGSLCRRSSGAQSRKILCDACAQCEPWSDAFLPCRAVPSDAAARHTSVDFKDYTSLLSDPAAFKLTIDSFARRYAGSGITHVVSAEARGLVLGAPLALALGLPFVPVRKPRCVPHGSARLEATATAHRRELSHTLPCVSPPTVCCYHGSDTTTAITTRSHQETASRDGGH